ncbi:hypothetical protein PaecuDRAFT_1021 [Paenibacillus curdlanolyticus YK9]|uniref:Uncharacterized protein n=1 Tax=Paenibacillus curdlanolyticus YK9 TaxID=717606 RepID=E0I5U9_9BACL|nr:hypothetical protein [Paenibacillus curdlanolyticus]EFM12341.1 hypothetical protein PaecuDRAFT_1021 [Paenibacillus curdlanolyticus YK9]
MHASPTIVYANRISDSETMANKLIYQVRSNHLSNTDLDNLQARCKSELTELRQELDEILNELRQLAAKMNASEADPFLDHMVQRKAA